MNLSDLFLKEYPTSTGWVLVAGGSYAGLKAYQTWLEVLELRRKLYSDGEPKGPSNRETQDQVVAEAEAAAAERSLTKAASKKRKKAITTTSASAVLGLVGLFFFWWGAQQGRDVRPPVLVRSEPSGGAHVELGTDLQVTLTFNEPITACVIADRPARIAEHTVAEATILAPREGETWSVPWKATDAAGNATSEQTLQFVLRDAHAPTLVRSEPQRGSIVDPAHEIEFKLTFDEPIKSCAIGKRAARLEEPTVATGTIRSPATGETWDVPWEATDSAGNPTGEQTLQLYLRDVRPPTLVRSDPRWGARVEQGSEVEVTLTFDEPIKACVIADRPARIVEPTVAQATIMAPREGENWDVSWEATDSAGNPTGEQTLQLVLPAPPPKEMVFTVSFARTTRGPVGGSCGQFSMSGRFFVEYTIDGDTHREESSPFSSTATSDGMSPEAGPTLDFSYLQDSATGRNNVERARVGFLGNGTCPGTSWPIDWSYNVLSTLSSGRVDSSPLETNDGRGTGALVVFSANWASRRRSR